MKFTNHEAEIIFINTDEGLQNLASTLNEIKEFAFDTEFDRFWREYGFKLFLLQIFDGHTCFIIDPLAIKNFKPLWLVFENPNICKVAYACLEDIQILKVNGCNPVNIFDLQVAAKLCNIEANSFSDLVALKFNVAIDKTYQRSNWRTRTLHPNQLIYAGNDVIWLLQLKQAFYETTKKNGTYYMLQEENLLCENVVVNEYTVKLTNKQIARFSAYHKAILLSLFQLRNTVAQAYNMPPANVVNDSMLEDIVENKAVFYTNKFKNGFCKYLQDDEVAKQQFEIIIACIDESIENIPEKKQRSTEYIGFEEREKRKVNAEYKCKILIEFLSKKYGNIAAEFILRGLKKSLQLQSFVDIDMRQYQRKEILQACEVSGLVI